MNKIYAPSTGISDWQRLLREPARQWRTGYSARALACSWEAAEEFPAEIANILRIDGQPAELLLAIPEYKVLLPGASHGESQNDIFALARIGSNTAAIMVEGKVEEPFAQCLDEWLVNASTGKQTRLAFLCELLGVQEADIPRSTYYQLLHRAASALIEAERFKADMAIMLVHSFSATNRWYDAFVDFAKIFGVQVEPGRLARIKTRKRDLYLGWVRGDPRYLTC